MDKELKEGANETAEGINELKEGASKPAEGLSFWEHLDVLRSCIIRIIVAVVAGAILAFCFKEPLFSVVLAPCHSDFVLYRLLNADAFNLHLINTGLAEQMLIHLRVAMYVGALVVSPYVIYVIFRFVSPALYANERRYSVRILGGAYVMFLVGLALNYLLIFPLTVRFLGLYQVSPDIDNMLTISSYVDTLMTLSLAFGIIFEIPVVCWLMARMGILRAEWMTRFRRHAVVVILIIAAIITPTTDAFTLILVSLPIWLLYELSILIVAKTNKRKQ